MASVWVILTVAVLTTNGEYFTAFHPTQKDIVHTPRGIPPSNFAPVHNSGFHGFPSSEPARIESRSLFGSSPEFTSHGNLIPSSGFRSIPSAHPDLIQQERIFERNPEFISSGNLVQQTKAFVEGAKTIFKLLGNNTQAQITFDLVFETSECLGDVDDVIELMDESVKLMEDNAPEIIYLEAIVEHLDGETDINEQISGSVKMLRTLGHLIPNLENLSPKLCLTNPKASVRSFKSLANALIHIRNHREIIIDDTARQHLDFSSKVMSDTAKFLKMMNKSLERFRKICEHDNMKGAAVYDTVVDIMESLAQLFEVLGFNEKVEAIKKQAAFVMRITVC